MRSEGNGWLPVTASLVDAVSVLGESGHRAHDYRARLPMIIRNADKAALLTNENTEVFSATSGEHFVLE
jgi:hypothetical protein